METWSENIKLPRHVLNNQNQSNWHKWNYLNIFQAEKKVNTYFYLYYMQIKQLFIVLFRHALLFFDLIFVPLFIHSFIYLNASSPSPAT